MANDVRTSVMELLLKGASPEDVAAAIGVDIGYIMGLQNDSQFVASYRAQRAARLSDKFDTDSAIDNLEVVALSRLTDLLPYETDINKVLRAFGTLNGAKRRSTDRGSQQGNGAEVVQITLPAHLMRHTKVEVNVDHQNQVVAVEGRVLQTMDTKTVLEMAGERSPIVADILSNKQALEDVTLDDL